MAHGSSSIDRPPPLLGQHNEELLREIGYADADILKLRQAGVTANPGPDAVRA
jgi:crotonobetainyl-CoA:carnitine CoA-transferase CaiB-like acyl-CoA transferase